MVESRKIKRPKRIKRLLNKYFTTSSLDKGNPPINYDVLEKCNIILLEDINSKIDILKAIKSELRDKLLNIYKSNGNKHKEFLCKNELEEAKNNLNNKLIEKAKLVNRIKTNL